MCIAATKLQMYCDVQQCLLWLVTANPTIYFCAASQFGLSTVTMTAEIMDGPTPGVRVTWSTTAPPQCVTSVMVNFRSRSLVATYTTTNTSETELIQTGLQCTTNYLVTVVVTGATPYGIRPTLRSRQVQVFTGEIYHNILCNHSNMTVGYLHRYTTAIRTES